MWPDNGPTIFCYFLVAFPLLKVSKDVYGIKRMFTYSLTVIIPQATPGSCPLLFFSLHYNLHYLLKDVGEKNELVSYYLAHFVKEVLVTNKRLSVHMLTCDFLLLW